MRDDNARNDGVRTLAALRNKQPLVLEHRYGEGRVVTVLTSAGPMWNGWARNPSYVVFQLELEKYIARHDRTVDRRIVGEPIELSIDPAEYLETVEIVSPDPTGERITRIQAAPPPNRPSSDGTASSSAGAKVDEKTSPSGSRKPSVSLPRRPSSRAASADRG